MRIGKARFLGQLRSFIEEQTGTPCYNNAASHASPFYAIQLMKTQQNDPKNEQIDQFNVSIHCISEKTKPYSNAKVLGLVDDLEAAIENNVKLDAPFEVYRQENLGLQTLKEDQSGEGHAVIEVHFHVQKTK